MAGVKPRQRRCEWCARAYFISNSNSRYCCRGCKERAHRDRKRNGLVKPQKKRSNHFAIELRGIPGNWSTLAQWARNTPHWVRSQYPQNRRLWRRSNPETPRTGE